MRWVSATGVFVPSQPLGFTGGGPSAWWRWLPALLVALFAPLRALAHPLEPTLVELRELGKEQWEAVAWKVSGAPPAPLTIDLPPGCGGRTLSIAPSASFTCPPGAMANQTLTVAGSGAFERDVWIRIRFLDGVEVAGSVDVHTGRFHATRLEWLPWTAVARTYFVRGVEHVLEGVDHLLFLLALVWLCLGIRQLVTTITMFTLGHTLALALAATSAVHLQQSAVEVFIGASIVLVARELWLQGSTSAPSLARYFGLPFGVLHGAGFASALEDLGVRLLPAIAAFNLGVECGQLVWVGVLALGVSALQRRPPLGRWGARITAVTVGVAGAWITWQRLAASLVPSAVWP